MIESVNPRIKLITNTPHSATDPMMGDDVPEGTVLVFGEDGTLDAVVSDDKTEALQENNTALHELEDVELI